MDLGKETEIAFWDCQEDQEVMDHSCVSSPPLHLNLACVLILLGTLQSSSTNLFMSFHICSILYEKWNMANMVRSKKMPIRSRTPKAVAFTNRVLELILRRHCRRQGLEWRSCQWWRHATWASSVQMLTQRFALPLVFEKSSFACNCWKAVGLILHMRMLLKGLDLASVQAITPAPSFSWFFCSGCRIFDKMRECHRIS